MHNGNLHPIHIKPVLAMLTIRKIYIAFIKLYQYIKNVSIDLFCKFKNFNFNKIINEKERNLLLHIYNRKSVC